MKSSPQLVTPFIDVVKEVRNLQEKIFSFQRCFVISKDTFIDNYQKDMEFNLEMILILAIFCEAIYSSV